MNNYIPIGFWKPESVSTPEEPLEGLFIDLDYSDLTIMDQTGSEPLVDRNVTDGQSNDLLIDWDYTPPGGYFKPDFTGTYLISTFGNFNNFNIGFPTITPVGAREFFATAKFKVNSSAATDGYAVLFAVSANDLIFIFKAVFSPGPTIGITATVIDQTDPFTEYIAGPYTLSAGSLTEAGFNVAITSGSSFDLNLLVEGSVEDTISVPIAIDQITEFQPGPSIISGTGLGVSNTVCEIHGYKLETTT